MRFDLRDHSIVLNLECTGYPNGKKTRWPICPVCGAECETIYRNLYGEKSGCDVCTEIIDAWEVPDCFPGREQ